MYFYVLMYILTYDSYGCVCAYLVLYEGVDPLQHAFTGELVGQVGFDLETQRHTENTLH